jgi:hypothetical protein
MECEAVQGFEHTGRERPLSLPAIAIACEITCVAGAVAFNRVGGRSPVELSGTHPSFY